MNGGGRAGPIRCERRRAHSPMNQFDILTAPAPTDSGLMALPARLRARRRCSIEVRT